MAVWAAHETEQLINLVRQNHTLYDPSANDYRNRDVLKTLWNNIANEMNRSGRIFLTDMDCRDRWNSLRDGYRRFVKDEQTTSNGSKPKKKKTWHWSEAMSFLKPHIQERTPTSVIASVDSNCNRNHHQRNHSAANNVVTSSVVGSNIVANNIGNNVVSNNSVTNNVTSSRLSNGVVSDDCEQDENNHQEISINPIPVSKWQSTSSSSVEPTITPKRSVSPLVLSHPPISHPPISHHPISPHAVSPHPVSHHPITLPQDPDEQFFRSLLPDVKILPPRQKGIFKIQVQQLLQEMLYPKECNSVSSPQQSHTARQPPSSQVAYGSYGSVYASERWPSVQNSCGYSKPHSS